MKYKGLCEVKGEHKPRQEFSNSRLEIGLWASRTLDDATVPEGTAVVISETVEKEIARFVKPTDKSTVDAVLVKGIVAKGVVEKQEGHL